jgi:protein arginine kinase activator
MGEDTRRVRIVRVSGGERQELELSLDEARELGIRESAPSAGSVAYIMDGVFAWHAAGARSDRTCPQCGTTHRELIVRRRAGCEQCYDTFSDTIERLLSVEKKDVAHAGRIPMRLQRFRRLIVDREILLDRLTAAVDEEDFESAASIRDEIRSIAIDEEDTETADE